MRKTGLPGFPFRNGNFAPSPPRGGRGGNRVLHSPVMHPLIQAKAWRGKRPQVLEGLREGGVTWIVTRPTLMQRLTTRMATQASHPTPPRGGFINYCTIFGYNLLQPARAEGAGGAPPSRPV